VTFWLAEYDGTPPTLWTTADQARGWCDEWARSDTNGEDNPSGWDWITEDGAEQMVWVADLDDRPTSRGPGRITPLEPDIEE